MIQANPKTDATGSIFALLLLALLSSQVSAEDVKDIRIQKGSILTGKAMAEQVKILMGDSNGREEKYVTFLQVSPKANPEYVCLAAIETNKLENMDCFPRKTSLTPTMY